MDLNSLNSVTTQSELLNWLSVNCITPITPAITGSDLGVIMQKIVSIAGSNGLVLFDAKNENYTLALTDKAIEINSSGANTLTVPGNDGVPFPVGSEIRIEQSGEGQTTISGAAGVTINAADDKKSLRTQFSGAVLIKKNTDTWWLSGDLVATPVIPAKIAKINLTNTGHDATSAGWTNNLYFSAIGTSLSLLTTLGGASGWSITAAVGTAGTAHFETLPSTAFGNADFPDDVLDTLWYVNGGTNISFVVSGLNPGKNYTVKTCTADNDTGDGPTKVTVGSSSQTGASPDHIAVELTFTNIMPGSNGSLSIIADNTAGATFPIINAITIEEMTGTSY